MSTETTEKPEEVGARSLAPSADYSGDAPDLPKIELPCFGCGCREVLRYPYAEDATTMWCTNCGTLHNVDDNDKVTASIPVLPASILEIFQSRPAIDELKEGIKKKAETQTGD